MGTVAVVAGPAQAAGCNSPIRYAPTTNAIYLTGGGSFTPTQIRTLCAVAPLRLVDAATGTWQLDADLVIQGGSKLVLKGTAVGGDVNTLRLRSLASDKATEVQQILASYGTIDIDTVNITSWDPARNGPDIKASRSATPLATDRGRAFIRALSTFAADGVTPQNSTMNIRNSKLSYLGYYGGEAYGVSYKARGCDRTHVAACKTLRVTGEQINNVFDRNYIGTYTWGANTMVFRGNTYSNNISYGLDPHDVSSNLIIDKNRFVHNGNHGLICSQLCDNLTITDNIAENNGVRPTDAIEPVDDPHEGQIHGIMLHRGITNTRVTGNTVTGQTTGAGIAIFDSSGNTVSGNKLDNNRFGIRLTVGSANNTITGNTINRSTENAILLFPGTDAAAYSTMSGRPTGNTFADNVISGTGSYGVRAVDSDGNVIRGGSMAGLTGALLFQRSKATMESITLPARQPVTLQGTSAVRTSVTLGVPRDAVVVKADQYSTVAYK
jgi:parallel beta-helix repeat protein